MMTRKIIATITTLCLMLCAWMPTAARKTTTHPRASPRAIQRQGHQGLDRRKTEDPVKIKAKKMNDEQRKAYYDKINADINKNWSVKDGELISTGKGLHLVTPDAYADFEMWDWKPESRRRLRHLCPRPHSPNLGPQPNPLTSGSDKAWWLVEQEHPRDPSQLADNPIGEWNRMYIHGRAYCTVILNGKKVVDNVVLENSSTAKAGFRGGPLQTHGSETPSTFSSAKLKTKRPTISSKKLPVMTTSSPRSSTARTFPAGPVGSMFPASMVRLCAIKARSTPIHRKDLPELCRAGIAAGQQWPGRPFPTPSDRMSSSRCLTTPSQICQAERSQVSRQHLRHRLCPSRLPRSAGEWNYQKSMSSATTSWSI